MTHRRKVVEPTLVLKGRKLDKMRAEVARHRAAHQKKRQKVLLLWALAGGGALCLGWLAGVALSPDKSAEAQGGQEGAESVLPGVSQAYGDARDRQGSSKASVRGDVARPAPVAEESTGVRLTSRRGAEAFSLDDLPDEDAIEEVDQSADEVREVERVTPQAPAASEEDADTFTLDDLPAD